MVALILALSGMDYVFAPGPRYHSIHDFNPSCPLKPVSYIHVHLHNYIFKSSCEVKPNWCNLKPCKSNATGNLKLLAYVHNNTSSEYNIVLYCYISCVL